MAYSIESIKRVLQMAKDIEEELNKLSVEDIKICISKGNRKIGKVMNVSLMPILTCANCSGCMSVCYDIKACLQYAKTVISARMRNTVLAKRDIDRFFALIDEAISRRRTNKFFRWHVAGDIISKEYLTRIIRLAIKHHDFVFWTYTKNYDVVNEYVREHGNDRFIAIPSNLNIMFSEWDGMEMNNPYGFPVFACRLKNGNKNRTDESFYAMYKCPGNCDICKEAKRGCIVGENTYTDEH